MDLGAFDRDAVGNRGRRRGDVDKRGTASGRAALLAEGGNRSDSGEGEGGDQNAHQWAFSRCLAKNGSSSLRIRAAMRLPWSPS